MLNAVEYMKEKYRMTEDCKIPCSNCPLSSNNNGCYETCKRVEQTFPEKAVEIVENWAKEHPVKTYLDDFLEKYPNAPIEDDGTPKTCPHMLDENAVEMNCLGDECLKCWKQPLIED